MTPGKTENQHHRKARAARYPQNERKDARLYQLYNVQVMEAYSVSRNPCRTQLLFEITREQMRKILSAQKMTLTIYYGYGIFRICSRVNFE
jgi:NADH:ubiquinone oxidoreductase subunit E